MSKVINGVEYTTFDDLWNSSISLTHAEKGLMQLKIDLAGKLIKVRKQKGLSQKCLAKMTGLSPSAIASLERMHTTPQIDTLFKVLVPLGYTIAIVPDEK